MKRISGFLRPHKHVSTDLGWSLELIPDPDDPFQPAEVFVTAQQLENAGIVPRLYRRISFVPRDLHELREPEQPKRPIRLHAGNGIAGAAPGIHGRKDKKARLA